MSNRWLHLTFLGLVCVPVVLGESVVTRSIIIEPYSKEKLEELNRNMKSFNAPFQKFLASVEALDKARAAAEANPGEATNVALVQAAGDAMGTFASFVQGVRESRPAIVYGLSDYADWLELSASDVERRAGDSETHKNSVKWLRAQSKQIRAFNQDLEKMFKDVDSVGEDLAVRAASWSQAYRVAKQLGNLGGGPEGRKGLYLNMTAVMKTAKNLKGFLTAATEKAYAMGTTEEEEQELKTGYQDALTCYFEE